MIGFDNLVPIDKNLVKPASLTATHAFIDDPETVYLIPDEAKRINLHYTFEYYLRVTVFGKGEAYTTSSQCEGVAIWAHSEQKIPFWVTIRANPFLPLRCGWRCVSHYMKANRITLEIKKQYAPPRHMYLALLAVDPAYQGKGHASALLKPMLARLDQEHLPAYLETQNMKNVAMYQHFGFKLVYETVLPKTTLPIYCMLREP
jgi:ribosomal protein S18 acetylase RimI-like enzyme